MKTAHPLLIVFFCCLLACNFLDDPEPTGSIPIGQAFRTADDIEAGLVGAYDAVQNGHLLGRNLIVFPDLMGGNADYTGSGWFGLPEIANLQISTTSWFVENLWRQAYLSISQVNQILASLPEVRRNDASVSPAEYDRMEGEAAFLRGAVYFELVRLFALPYEEQFLDSLGVPLVLEPVLSKEDLRFPSRATIGEVYQQVIQDLDLAIEKLQPASQRGRANRFTALAYRACVAFQQRDYDSVKQLTLELVENSPFKLTDTPGKFFMEKGTAEAIWVLLNEPGDGITGGGLSNMFYGSTVRPNLKSEGYEKIVTPEQLSRIEADGFRVVDLRVDTGFISNYPFVTPDTAFVRKYTDDSDTPVARLAEFMLMRAEALARTGDMESAVFLLNKIRGRSLRIVGANGFVVPEAEKDYVFFETTDDVLEAIIRERRVELAFEGNYFHDLMRLKSEDVQGKRYDDPKLRFPIPQREMDANPALVQNTGY